jgi:hypothetical protein
MFLSRRLQQSSVWTAIRNLRIHSAVPQAGQAARKPWCARRRGLFGATAVGTLSMAGFTVFGLEVPGLDDGLVRSLRFWRYAGPIYAHYRLTERMVESLPEAEQDKAFEELHNKYAPQIKKLILLLRGFYIKVGQMGATRADFVPQQYIDELETLQVSVRCSCWVCKHTTMVADWLTMLSLRFPARGETPPARA